MDSALIKEIDTQIQIAKGIELSLEKSIEELRLVEPVETEFIFGDKSVKRWLIQCYLALAEFESHDVAHHSKKEILSKLSANYEEYIEKHPYVIWKIIQKTKRVCSFLVGDDDENASKEAIDLDLLLGCIHKPIQNPRTALTKTRFTGSGKRPRTEEEQKSGTIVAEMDSAFVRSPREFYFMTTDDIMTERKRELQGYKRELQNIQSRSVVEERRPIQPASMDVDSSASDPNPFGEVKVQDVDLRNPNDPNALAKFVNWVDAFCAEPDPKTDTERYIFRSKVELIGRLLLRLQKGEGIKLDSLLSFVLTETSAIRVEDRDAAFRDGAIADTYLIQSYVRMGNSQLAFLARDVQVNLDAKLHVWFDAFKNMLGSINSDDVTWKAYKEALAPIQSRGDFHAWLFRLFQWDQLFDGSELSKKLENVFLAQKYIIPASIQYDKNMELVRREMTKLEHRHGMGLTIEKLSGDFYMEVNGMRQELAVWLTMIERGQSQELASRLATHGSKLEEYERLVTQTIAPKINERGFVVMKNAILFKRIKELEETINGMRLNHIQNHASAVVTVVRMNRLLENANERLGRNNESNVIDPLALFSYDLIPPTDSAETVALWLMGRLWSIFGVEKLDHIKIAIEVRALAQFLMLITSADNLTEEHKQFAKEQMDIFIEGQYNAYKRITEGDEKMGIEPHPDDEDAGMLHVVDQMRELVGFVKVEGFHSNEMTDQNFITKAPLVLQILLQRYKKAQWNGERRNEIIFEFYLQIMKMCPYGKASTFHGKVKEQITYIMNAIGVDASVLSMIEELKIDGIEDIDQLKEYIKQLRRGAKDGVLLGDLNVKYQAAATKCDLLVVENNSMRENIQRLEGQKSILEKNDKEAKERAASDNLKINQLTAENGTLTDQLREKTSSNTSYTQAEEGLIQQVRQLEDRIKILQDELETAHVTIDDHATYGQEVLEEKDDLETKFVELKEEHENTDMTVAADDTQKVNNLKDNHKIAMETLKFNQMTEKHKLEEAQKLELQKRDRKIELLEKDNLEMKRSIDESPHVLLLQQQYDDAIATNKEMGVFIEDLNKKILAVESKYANFLLAFSEFNPDEKLLVEKMEMKVVESPQHNALALQILENFDEQLNLAKEEKLPLDDENQMHELRVEDGKTAHSRMMYYRTRVESYERVWARMMSSYRAIIVRMMQTMHIYSGIGIQIDEMETDDTIKNKRQKVTEGILRMLEVVMVGNNTELDILSQRLGDIRLNKRNYVNYEGRPAETMMSSLMDNVNHHIAASMALSTLPFDTKLIDGRLKQADYSLSANMIQVVKGLQNELKQKDLVIARLDQFFKYYSEHYTKLNADVRYLFENREIDELKTRDSPVHLKLADMLEKHSGVLEVWKDELKDWKIDVPESDRLKKLDVVTKKNGELEKKIAEMEKAHKTLTDWKKANADTVVAVKDYIFETEETYNENLLKADEKMDETEQAKVKSRALTERIQKLRAIGNSVMIDMEPDKKVKMIQLEEKYNKLDEKYKVLMKKYGTLYELVKVAGNHLMSVFDAMSQGDRPLDSLIEMYLPESTMASAQREMSRLNEMVYNRIEGGAYYSFSTQKEASVYLERFSKTDMDAKWSDDLFQAASNCRLLITGDEKTITNQKLDNGKVLQSSFNNTVVTVFHAWKTTLFSIINEAASNKDLSESIEKAQRSEIVFESTGEKMRKEIENAAQKRDKLLLDYESELIQFRAALKERLFYLACVIFEESPKRDKITALEIFDAWEKHLNPPEMEAARVIGDVKDSDVKYVDLVKYVDSLKFKEATASMKRMARDTKDAEDAAAKAKKEQSESEKKFKQELKDQDDEHKKLISKAQNAMNEMKGAPGGGGRPHGNPDGVLDIGERTSHWRVFIKFMSQFAGAIPLEITSLVRAELLEYDEDTMFLSGSTQAQRKAELMLEALKTSLKDKDVGAIERAETLSVQVDAETERRQKKIKRKMDDFNMNAPYMIETLCPEYLKSKALTAINQAWNYLKTNSSNYKNLWHVIDSKDSTWLHFAELCACEYQYKILFKEGGKSTSITTVLQDRINIVQRTLLKNGVSSRR